MQEDGVRGFIFDIERFSTADGPGIRTVLFFKGCNLHCYWCHNPESIRTEPELEWNPSECIGCGLCASVCPSGAHAWTPEHIILRQNCTHCFRCSEICPAQALKQAGKWMDVEACMAQIRPDIPFYSHSGGGVTLSGGEVLLQSAFAGKLLHKCREEGIHTAIESNLCFPQQSLDTLLPHLDLVMADIKHTNPQRHKAGTGASNAQVFQNLRYLDGVGMPLIIRTPVIPGYNDTPENIGEAADFLKELNNLQYYELLSYNPMGNDKRKRFGYGVPDIAVPGKQQMQKLAEIVRLRGIPVWIDGRIFA